MASIRRFPSARTSSGSRPLKSFALRPRCQHVQAEPPSGGQRTGNRHRQRRGARARRGKRDPIGRALDRRSAPCAAAWRHDAGGIQRTGRSGHSQRSERRTEDGGGDPRGDQGRSEVPRCADDGHAFLCRAGQRCRRGRGRATSDGRRSKQSRRRNAGCPHDAPQRRHRDIPSQLRHDPPDQAEGRRGAECRGPVRRVGRRRGQVERCARALLINARSRGSAGTRSAARRGAD